VTAYIAQCIGGTGATGEENSGSGYGEESGFRIHDGMI
jgi:hypothetical protein